MTLYAGAWRVGKAAGQDPKLLCSGFLRKHINIIIMSIAPKFRPAAAAAVFALTAARSVYAGMGS